MHRLKILLGLLALFVLLTAPAYFEEVEPDGQRGTFATAAGAANDAGARGVLAVVSRRGERVTS